MYFILYFRHVDTQDDLLTVLTYCRIETTRNAVAAAQKGKREKQENQVHCLSAARIGENLQPSTVPFSSETSSVITDNGNF